MLCAVLKQWHPIMGVDLHIPWPPGSPSPAPSPVPYKTCTTMYGLGVKASTATTHVQQGFGWTMQVPTDVGPMIPHVGAPSVTLPIEMIFSASKSYFGPANTETQGERIGAAVLGLVNLNLDCGIPIPTPTGVVLAFVSVYTNMSQADVLYGWNSMALDFCVQSLLNVFGSAVGAYLGPSLNYMLGRFAPQVMSRATAARFLGSQGVAGNSINRLARELVDAQSRALSNFMSRLPARTGNIAGGLSNFFIGGPMGTDASDVGLTTPGGMANESVQTLLNNPSVEEHGSSGGAGGGG